MAEEVKVFKFKVALLGDSRVGKTSLVKKFVYDDFDDNYIVTLGAKTVAKTVMLKTEKGETLECDLQVWDVLGQKRFKRLQKTFFSGTQGAFIVSDITQPESFKSSEDWTEMLFAVTGPVPLVYALNKFDLIDEQKEFKKEDLENIVEQNPGMFFLSSAKTGLNVEAFFHRMAQILAEAVLKEPILEYDPNAPGEELPKPKPPVDLAPPPDDTVQIVTKPEGGTCSACKAEHLLFYEDGRGDCPDCGREFWWDESKKPPPPPPE